MNLKERIKSISIHSIDSILFALKRMDSTYKRLLLVFDKNSFVGLLSIGDIQRAIINGIPLESSVSLILRKNIRIAKDTDHFEDVKQKMLEFRTECMPIVNLNGELVNVHFWEDIFGIESKRKQTHLNLPVILMAGGKGSRLLPLTNVLPKPLVPIGEKTILEEIMDRFVNVGCDNFYISVNYKAEIIKYYFHNLNYKIEYFQENKPLGTAGSMYLIKEKINSTFFVSNCDIIIDQDLDEIYTYHKQNKNDITIVSALKHHKVPYGTIETAQGGILKSFSEKPELIFQINTGMYILEPHLLNDIPEDTFFHITELIEKIQDKKGGKVGVFPVSEGSWKDIGDWGEYLKYCTI